MQQTRHLLCRVSDTQWNRIETQLLEFSQQIIRLYSLLLHRFKSLIERLLAPHLFEQHHHPFLGIIFIMRFLNSRFSFLEAKIWQLRITLSDKSKYPFFAFLHQEPQKLEQVIDALLLFDAP